jgi:hypothetical protein
MHNAKKTKMILAIMWMAITIAFNVVAATPEDAAVAEDIAKLFISRTLARTKTQPTKRPTRRPNTGRPSTSPTATVSISTLYTLS